MPGRTEKEHDDPESGKQISLPIYELNASRIEVYIEMFLNILILSFHLRYFRACGIFSWRIQRHILFFFLIFSFVKLCHLRWFNQHNARWSAELQLFFVKFPASFCYFPFLWTKRSFRTIWQRLTSVDFLPFSAVSFKIQTRHYFPLRYSISLVGFIVCWAPILLCRINRPH